MLIVGDAAAVLVQAKSGEASAVVSHCLSKCGKEPFIL
jgi:hypothetical protein